MSSSDRYTTSDDPLVTEFRTESDRGVAIIGAALLETRIEAILSKLMPNAAAAEIFVSRGPLDTYSAKIDVAHAIGCIGNDVARALHLSRRIRNRFAHPDSAGLSFEASPIRDIADEFDRALFSEHRLGPEDLEYQRPTFVLGVAFLMGQLEQTREHVTPLDRSALYRNEPEDADSPD